MIDYATHSKMSQPGRFSYLYDDLPTDIDKLHHVVNNVFVHIWKMRKFDISDERKSDFATRRVESILERMMAYDDSPATIQRPRAQQFIGDCRHAALLLCSMLRQQGIPARIRHGYCQYISSKQENYSYHVITEYWDGERWILEDPDIIRHDIPRGEFVLGAQAWQQYRAGDLNPDQFFISGDIQGDWQFPIPMLRDLASLAKYETTSTDMWGVIAPNYELTSDEKIMLDDTATLLIQDDTLETIYQKYPILKVSQPMMAWDWVTNAMLEFDISLE